MSLFTFFFSPRISSQANVIGKPGLLVSPYNNNNNNSPVKWGCVQGNLQQIAGLGSEASSGAQTLFFNRDSDLLLDPYLPRASVLPSVINQTKVLFTRLIKAQKFLKWKPIRVTGLLLLILTKTWFKNNKKVLLCSWFAFLGLWVQSGRPIFLAAHTTHSFLLNYDQFYQSLTRLHQTRHPFSSSSAYKKVIFAWLVSLLKSAIVQSSTSDQVKT